jgi:hypothetical protein
MIRSKRYENKARYHVPYLNMDGDLYDPTSLFYYIITPLRYVLRETQAFCGRESPRASQQKLDRA